MVGLLVRVRISLLAFALAIGGHSLAIAAPRPGVPSGKNVSRPQFTPLGETEFTCGTYRGNEKELPAREALHLANQSLVKQGIKRVSPAGLDYVYDNVWVIEDDGSLTLSGTNFFDTDNKQFKYTNNGGGVHTVTLNPYSYDATLGTLISPGDDGAVLVNLPFSFPYGGTNWTQMYVSGNGAVSFGAVVNPNGFFDVNDFFSSTPKIAAYYLDLDVTHAGGVGAIRVSGDATQYTVSWINVNEYASAATNTFQLRLFPSGSFTITYNGIGSNVTGDPITVGYNPGGTPTFETMSLSGGLPHVSAPDAAVYEQYYSFPNPLVDEIALLKRFYQEYPDDFFQVIYFANFNEQMGGAFAYERNIKNDVTGIGLDIFDGSGQYGSSGKLESLCNMGPLDQWTASDPAARVYGAGNNYLTIQGQESGHRWGAFVLFDTGAGPSDLLLGRSLAHWSYYADVDHSSLEGGDWVSTGGSNYMCPTNIDYYSELDEYLFGLRTPNEVKDLFFISSISNNTVSARSQKPPLMGAVASGTFVPVTVENVIAASGARTPVEANEEHDLRQAFILLVAHGTVPSQAQLDKIAGFRRAWEPYFEKACDGRLSCNTSITSTYAVGVIDGQVRDKYRQTPVPDFTARSVERGFSQHVPADGRFIFRYDDDATRGTSEPVTLIFSAPGYVPDTLSTSITYGATQHLTGLNNGIWLKPVPTGAGATPGITELRANHPNPFNPTTTIEYSLAQPGRVQIRVYDAAGHRVRTLVDGVEAKGNHQVDFDGLDDHGQALASGVYIYRLDSGGVTRSRKMVLLK